MKGIQCKEKESEKNQIESSENVQEGGLLPSGIRLNSCVYVTVMDIQ